MAQATISITVNGEAKEVEATTTGVELFAEDKNIIAFKSKLERFGMLAIVLLSWGIALFEYCFQVPANRIGSAQFGGPFSIWELKVIQEVVSLSVFTLFALVFMKSDTLRWNHLAGFLCLILAVYFIFRK